MQHDPDLLEQLDRLPKESFAGEVFRATRQNLDPLMPSTSGGRWMPRDEGPILYTSLLREGALAEIAFHWSQLTPMPTSDRHPTLVALALRNCSEVMGRLRCKAGIGARRPSGRDGSVTPADYHFCGNRRDVWNTRRISIVSPRMR